MRESLAELIVRGNALKIKLAFNSDQKDEQQRRFNEELTKDKALLTLNAKVDDAYRRGKAYTKLLSHKDEDENHGCPLHGDALYSDLHKIQLFQTGYSADDNITRLKELGDNLEPENEQGFNAFLDRVAVLVRKPLELQEESVRRVIELEIAIAEQMAGEIKEDLRGTALSPLGPKRGKKSKK